MTVETSDIWSAAYCIAKGAKLVSVTPDWYSRFVFDDSTGYASKCIGEFYEPNTTCQVTALMAGYRACRRAANTAKSA